MPLNTKCKYVVRHIDGSFLTARRATGKAVYNDRSGFEQGIENAKIFNSVSAAKNSVRHTFVDELEWNIYEAHVSLGARL